MQPQINDSKNLVKNSKINLLNALNSTTIDENIIGFVPKYDLYSISLVEPIGKLDEIFPVPRLLMPEYR